MMDMQIALEEIMLYETMKRWNAWYLEKETGRVAFITYDERIAGITELPEEDYIECPYCARYLAKEFILARGFGQALLEQYEIDMTLEISKYSPRNDDRMNAFARNAGRMRHDLRLNEDYYKFYRPILKEFTIEWLKEIQDQLGQKNNCVCSH